VRAAVSSQDLRGGIEMQPMDVGAICFAVPKGRLVPGTAALLSKAGIDTLALLSDERSLIRTNGSVSFALIRNEDVPTYVERGAAAVGFVGKDVLREQGNRDLIEYADLGIGECHLVVAAPEGTQLVPDGFVRVATKYPNLARQALDKLGLRYEIITLRGSCEIAPRAGLADAIVDLKSTGETLRANNLIEVCQIESFTATLVLNPQAYRTDSRVREIAEKISAATRECAS